MARAATSLTLAAVIALAISTHAFTSLPQPNVNANAKYHATKLYGSGGMDAYAAQMAAMMGNAPPASNSEPPSAAAAPVAAQPAPAAASFSGGASASAAISSMAASQASVLSQIAASIPDLAPKPDLSYDASSGFTVNGRTVSLDARDAPGPANIAWISSLCVDDALSSLTIFNGPLTDVPHLISRCAIRDDGQMHFFLDFRPRAYGAYDLRNADGSYPGPETLGRKSFEYSGARKDFDGKFGNEEVVQFLNGVMSQLEGAVRSGEDMTTLNELEKVTRGPLAMDLIVPLSENNINTIISAREKAANYWLSWALDPSHGHRPGAPVNSQYVYDSKYKINAYGALLDVYSSLYGQADGAALAAADSGPLDEAYVGGGS